MTSKKLAALLVLLASPIVLFATHETDRKIENAAKASYNFRTVLEDHVKVKSNDGVVTLTGTVQDKDDKALGTKLARDVRGTNSVTNDMRVKS